MLFAIILFILLNHSYTYFTCSLSLLYLLVCLLAYKIVLAYLLYLFYTVLVLLTYTVHTLLTYIYNHTHLQVQLYIAYIIKISQQFEQIILFLCLQIDQL